VVIRPPTYYVDGLMFYQGFFSFFLSFVLSSSFFHRLISELAEPNSTKIGHMVGSKCNLKMHVRNLVVTRFDAH